MWQIIDDKGIRRRFRASNYQSATRVKPFICTMPLRLDDGWNQVQFNLADFCKRAYGTQYMETQRIQVEFFLFHSFADPRQLSSASCLLRRPSLRRGGTSGRIQVVFTGQGRSQRRRRRVDDRRRRQFDGRRWRTTRPSAASAVRLPRGGGQLVEIVFPEAIDRLLID